MSGSSTGWDRRRRVGVVVVAAAFGVLPLAACSVPREADLASDASALSPSSPSPSPALAVAASPTPSPSASPSPSPSPTPSPTFAPLKPPTPKAVKGYTLRAAPGSVPNPLKGVKGANEVFGASTVRSVSTKGRAVGLLFLFAVRPQYLNDPQVTDAVVSRLANSISRSGVPLKQQRLGRRTVCAGSSDRNGTIVLWYRGGVLSVVVGGGDKDAVLSYAKALAAVS